MTETEAQALGIQVARHDGWQAIIIGLRPISCFVEAQHTSGASELFVVPVSEGQLATQLQAAIALHAHWLRTPKSRGGGMDTDRDTLIKGWKVGLKSVPGKTYATRHNLQVSEELELSLSEGYRDDLVIEDVAMTAAQWDDLEENAPEFDGW